MTTVANGLGHSMDQADLLVSASQQQRVGLKTGGRSGFLPNRYWC